MARTREFRKFMNLQNFRKKNSNEIFPPAPSGPMAETDRQKTTGEKGSIVLPTRSTERGSCWSITIFNENEYDNWKQIPGWVLKGQVEACPKTGKNHLQAMLRTPQVRFSAVKSVFPTSHIEKARDVVALSKYVHKEESRVETYDSTGGVPSLFQYQDTIAGLWDEREFNRRCNDDIIARSFKYDIGDMALAYVDELVSEEISAGKRGIEFIAVNPMWRSSWKKFYRSIIKRHGSLLHQPATQEAVFHQTANSEYESRNTGTSICSEGSEEGSNVICEPRTGSGESEIRD